MWRWAHKGTRAGKQGRAAPRPRRSPRHDRAARHTPPFKCRALMCRAPEGKSAQPGKALRQAASARPGCPGSCQVAGGTVRSLLLPATSHQITALVSFLPGGVERPPRASRQAPPRHPFGTVFWPVGFCHGAEILAVRPDLARNHRIGTLRIIQTNRHPCPQAPHPHAF